jgi:CBS-domain-containing membrane protein
MTHDVLTIAPDATLGDAVAAMKTFRICCLPVVDESDGVLGLLTRGRLRAVGVPSALVGPERCARCHAEHTPLDDDELCPQCSSSIDWPPNVVSDGEPA